MSTISLGILETVAPDTIWKNEERDFTPWVAENIAHISTVIGIPLVVEQTEKRVGAYELDIYARVEGSDKAVIIENQLGKTDHKHLGQLLTYAAGLDAAVVIWIAPEATDEHKAAIEWLNKLAKESISFFLLSPEVVKIGNSLPAARFHLVVGPSEFARAISLVVDDDEAPRHGFRRAFWTGLFEALVLAGQSWAAGRRTTKDGSINLPIGKAGIGVNVSMASGSRIRVEIYIYRDENKETFDLLHSKQAEIEARVPGEKVSWERLDDALASRVAVYREYNKSSCESDSPERRALYSWIVQNVIRFREVAKKYLQE